MKKLLMFVVALMSAACGRHIKAPENSDFYAVDTTEINEDSAKVNLHFRAIPMKIPIEKCDGLRFEKGSLVRIDDS